MAVVTDFSLYVLLLCNGLSELTEMSDVKRIKKKTIFTINMEHKYITALHAVLCNAYSWHCHS
jgi:hypothetical protein